MKYQYILDSGKHNTNTDHVFSVSWFMPTPSSCFTVMIAIWSEHHADPGCNNTVYKRKEKINVMQ